MKAALPLLALALLALSGCQQDAKQAKATGGNAAGEILPGSTSDAMIPVDTLRSQPPAAPKVEGSAKPKAAVSDAAPEAADAAPAAEAPADPASAAE